MKVLIVDDDKLVRKGLISAMPWRDFDMQVVGEASHGESALKYMEEHPVDLLLTDLAMPVMSGLDLMREVRRRFPQVHIVVLTLHQDFEYIQEALRMGAVDYIAKVQLEQERFEEVLKRIADRVREQRQGGTHERERGVDGAFVADGGAALLPLRETADDTWIARLPMSVWPEESLVAPEHRLWLWAFAETWEQQPLLRRLSETVGRTSGWALVRLTGLSGQSQGEVLRRLREYREQDLFYDYSPHDPVCEMSLQVQPHHPQTSETDFRRLKDRWSSPEWMIRPALFSELRLELKRLRLPRAKIAGLLFTLADEWNRILYPLTQFRITPQDTWDCWTQIESWLENTHASIHHAMGKLSFSQEVTDCIMEAVNWIHREIGQPLTAADLAKRVNLSRSYFSECFKDIVGQTFNEYVRRVRIDKAKEHLLYTGQTIQGIAEKIGYQDEKYFSRVFREQTGMLPSEFRNKHLEDR